MRSSAAKGQQQQQQQQSAKTGAAATSPRPAAAAEPAKVVEKLNLKRYVPRYVKSGERNHTSDYDQVAKRRSMVVRRGEYFYLDLEFEEVFDDYDLLSFRVTTEDFGHEQAKKSWHLKEEPTRFSDNESYHCPIQIKSVIIYPGNNKVTVVFFTAKNSIIGKFWITQMYATRSLEITFNYDIKFAVSVIYNPFNPDDDVYMPDDAERKEYVLNTTGHLYFGSSSSIGKRPWYFGQFDDPVLDCAFLLLAKSGLDFESWGNPVAVSRTLSAMMNSNDDKGLLVGRWGSDYSGGRAPSEWNSSQHIIASYFETQTPVCFGQCWVFSGLLTSVARAVGIPTRSVTNFDSAHDANCNLTLDYFFDENYNPVAAPSGDSVWNFHVWNDVWMRRPDLQGEYHGWQAIDATPQERSEGVYRTGPCPLKAIKEGKLDVDFDAPFLYAEVNACIKHWLKAADGSNKELFSDPTKIGKHISTKAVGSDDRLDITDQYKFPEGSREEEAAFRAAKNSKKVQIKGERTDDNKRRRNLQLNIVTEQYLVIGRDIRVILELINTARTDKNFVFGLSVGLKQYNGHIIKQLAHQKSDATVKGGATTPVEIIVPAAEYESLSGLEEVGIQIFAVGLEGNEKVVKQTVVHLFNPEIEIEISGEVAQNKAFHLKCTFPNPVPFALTDAVFNIEGPGLRDNNWEKKVGQVNPGDKASCSITLVPVRSGERSFIVAFDSKELKGVEKSYPVFVVPDPNAIAQDDAIQVGKKS